jgi:radical SAM superfamily enzyme YgiQ (UPF0313 family)
MKIVLCSIPSVALERSLRPLIPKKKDSIGQPEIVVPFGILRVLSSLEKKGYSADIYDINNLRPSDEELIETFKRVNPTVVGLSGTLSQCYPNIKRISKILRELFPDIWIVVGGHLTGSSNVVLHKTEADICIVGDGEIPFVKLLDYFKLHPTRRQLDYTGLHQIKGLAFIDKNNKLKVTGYAEQLSSSELLFPDFDKLRLGLQKFGGNGELIHEYFPPIKRPRDLGEYQGYQQNQLNSESLTLYEKNIDKKVAPVFSSKGCVARCTFCQRGTKGYSAYVPSDLENHVIELKEKYNVGALSFFDENFGSDKKQSYEIARIMKKHDLIWEAPAVRVTSVTYEDLKFYKEHNMVYINFGIETGSQKILDIMEKKNTTESIYNAVSNCKKLGISTFPFGFLFGMPGETEKTVKETAEFRALLSFLLEKDWNVNIAPFLAMAIPGTPLYEYCQQIQAIGKSLDEEEDYLIRLSEFDNQRNILNYVNKTNSSLKEVHYWLYLYQYAGKKAQLNLIIKNNKSIKQTLLKIYKQCIKGIFNNVVFEFNRRKDYYKNKKFTQKIKWYTVLSINFLLSLAVLFLPQTVLFPIVRFYANMRFNYLHKIHKLKKDKHKYNLFVENRNDPTSSLRFSENRITKTSRQIDRSLRKVVMENRKQMKPAITNEEIGLQILGQGQ